MRVVYRLLLADRENDSGLLANRSVFTGSDVDIAAARPVKKATIILVFSRTSTPPFSSFKVSHNLKTVQ
ncbi:hypothetical protein TWF718_011303 [Orbilia javanica]|uniref:Uncharacterized protein n=1 Tax=Orbilia javanica TaxID=47235 RepID=A0AAN8R9L7_9PEZI